MEKHKKVLMAGSLETPFGMPYPLIPTDPEGSYTGVPENPTELPVQDADDL